VIAQALYQKVLHLEQQDFRPRRWARSTARCRW